MSEPSTLTFDELEAAIAAANQAVESQKPKFEAASARLAQVRTAVGRSSGDLTRLDREMAAAGEKYAEAYIGGSKKPDAATLLKLKAERELFSLAAIYARTALPKAQAAALEAEAVLLDKQASLKYAEADMSRARGLLAFQSVADAFGQGAAVEIHNAEWQKIREHGDALIHSSRALREQAEDILQQALAGN